MDAQSRGQHDGSPPWECTRRWLGEFIDTAVDVDRYRRDMVEHIAPSLGHRPLVEVITPAEVAALLDQVRADASSDIAKQVRATLRELFADAADDGLIDRSPFPLRSCQ